MKHAGGLLLGAWVLCACGPAPVEEPPVACAELPAPADGQTQLALGQSIEDQFVDVDAENEFLLHFGQQGGQTIPLWGRLYAPERAHHWWVRVELDAATNSEEVGGVEWYVPACSSGWTDAYVPLFVYEEMTRGACVMSIHAEAFDEAELSLGANDATYEVVVLNPMAD